MRKNYFIITFSIISILTVTLFCRMTTSKNSEISNLTLRNVEAFTQVNETPQVNNKITSSTQISCLVGNKWIKMTRIDCLPCKDQNCVPMNPCSK